MPQPQTIQDYCDKILRLTLRSTYDNHVIEPLNKNLRKFYGAYSTGQPKEVVEAAAKDVEGSLLIWGNYQSTQGLIVYATNDNTSDANRLIDELYDLVDGYKQQ